MRFGFLPLFLGVAALLPLTGVANAATFSGNATVTTNYIYRGLTKSDGDPVLQFSAELESNGFYGGVFASRVDFGTADSLEFDLSVGYRGTAGSMAYDLGYTRFHYDGSGDCCGEIQLSASAPLGRTFVLGGEMDYNPVAEKLATAVNGQLALSGTTSLSGSFGYDGASSENYWDAGMSYQLNKAIALDMRYHDRTSGSAAIVGSVKIGFSTR